MGKSPPVSPGVSPRHECRDSALVVGAGFSGVMVAYRLVLSGYPVCLVDMASQPGGVMRDDVFKGGPHLSGCHVIQNGMPENHGFSLPASDELTLVDNQVSSWTQSSAGVQRQKHVEGPISSADPCKWIAARSSTPNNRHDSVRDRLERYPKEVGRELLHWTGSLKLDLEQVHQDSLEALQLKRVFFASRYTDALRELKSRDSEADELFGVTPRHPRKVLVAKNGYSRWYKAAIDELIELGVDYRPETAAKPRIHNGHLCLELSGALYAPAVGFWCANPNPLGKALMPGTSWDGQSQLLTSWHVEVDQNVNDTFNYVQFFGHPQGIIRATKYEFGGTHRVVVESVASSRKLVKQATDTVFEATKETGATPLNYCGSVTRRAYLTMSVADAHRLHEMGKRLGEFGWIHSGLQYFSRPRRLAWLDKEMRHSTAFVADSEVRH